MNDIIIGGGEVGTALYELLGKNITVVDIDKTKEKNIMFPIPDIDIMHVCFPYVKMFKHFVTAYSEKFKPKMIVIHSTVPIGTSYSIQSLVKDVPVIYAPTRGVHSRFVEDMKSYTKLWASVNPITEYEHNVFKNIWDNIGVKTERWDSIKDLELAKVLIDTTYYGWLISFRFAADAIADNYGADKEKIWDFAKEIHEKLGNRPTMFSNPDGIGGHCVLPNLELNNDHTTEYIKNVINVLNANHRKRRNDN